MVFQGVYLMLAIFFMADAKLHEEPDCSKFHFEEKVLEKLVRLEHQVHIYQTKLKHWDEKMDEQFLKLTDAEVARTDKLTTLSDSIQQELEGQKVKLDQVLANFQQQVVRLSQDLMDKQGDINKTLLDSIRNQDTAINKIKVELTTPTILFTAKTVADTKLTVGSLLRYTETVTNIGEGYDSSTGFFTTPQDGTYIFNVQICNPNQQWLMVQIVAADIIASVSNYDKNVYVTNAGTGLAVLSAGDKVWVKCTQPGVVYNGDSKRPNSFSGVLIHPNTK